MGFYFFCPEGHILEAEPDQVGEAAACPFCSVTMIIPQPLPQQVQKSRSVTASESAASESAASKSGSSADEARGEAEGPWSSGVTEDARWPSAGPAVSGERGNQQVSPAEEPISSPEGAPGSPGGLELVGPPVAGAEEVETLPAGGNLATAAEAVYHIACPFGHVLETPGSMLGMDVMCPVCHNVFQPQFEASEEYRQRQEELAAKAARFWLRCAIVAAVLILGGLILLIVLAPR